MTPEELKSRGGIYFERIQEGMEAYEWESRYLSPSKAEEFLTGLWKENGQEGAYVDCYYPFLEEESKEKVLSVLDKSQREYLEALAGQSRELLLPMDEQLLSIAVTLNDREMLFFTFYFLHTPCTIWGNYKQEYLIFRKKGRREKED